MDKVQLPRASATVFLVLDCLLFDLLSAAGCRHRSVGCCTLAIYWPYLILDIVDGALVFFSFSFFLLSSRVKWSSIRLALVVSVGSPMAVENGALLRKEKKDSYRHCVYPTRINTFFLLLLLLFRSLTRFIFFSFLLSLAILPPDKSMRKGRKKKSPIFYFLFLK